MKRFFDTEIFQKSWFMDLSPSEKAAWFYLLSHCDNVGVWKPNLKLADFIIGEQVNWQALKDHANGNIIEMESGKWWIVDFCRFQHPDLDESSTAKPVQSYIKLLKSHGLWKEYQRVSIGYAYSMDNLSIGSKDKDKDKERERVKDRVRARVRVKEEQTEKTEIEPDVYLSDSELETLSEKYGKRNTEVMAARLSAYMAEKGKTYTDHYRTLNNWLKRDDARPPEPLTETPIPDFMQEVLG